MAKAGIQLKLNNMKYPYEIEVGQHFVLFSDMIPGHDSNLVCCSVTRNAIYYYYFLILFAPSK